MYNYEEYMRNVLGISVPNTYQRTNYYNTMRVNSNMQEVNSLYPEIYKIVYPIVQKVCSRNSYVNVTKDQIEKMVEEIYNVIEPKENQEANNMTQEQRLKNGDVRNPRAKEEVPKQEIQNNNLLKDLIRILVIREILSKRQEMSPNMYPGNSMQGGINMGQMPPIMRGSSTMQAY